MLCGRIQNCHVNHVRLTKLSNTEHQEKLFLSSTALRFLGMSGIEPFFDQYLVDKIQKSTKDGGQRLQDYRQQNTSQQLPTSINITAIKF